MADRDVERRIERGGKVKKRQNGGAVVFLVSVVAVMVFLTIIVIILKGNEAPADKRNVVVNKDNVEEIVANLADKEKVGGGHYEVTMNSEWTFANGASASENAYVENAVTNTNDVYFDVNLRETGELIYSSPIIPRGGYLENITLDKELTAGTYDCILTYHLVDEEQNTISTLQLTLTIKIES